MLTHQSELLAKEEQIKEEKIKALIQGQENEQHRIGSELHDGVGMEIAAIKLHLHKIKKQLTENNLSVQNYDEIISLLDGAYSTVRSLSHTMIPEYITKVGLQSSLKEIIDSINKSDKILATLSVSEFDVSMDAQSTLMIFRVVQELILNSMKHSNATKLEISLYSQNERRVISISDNGKGFNLSSSNFHKGAGFHNIESRVKFLNGSFTINAEIDKGTTAILVV